MKRGIVFSLMLITFFCLPAFAEKIPVRLTPLQVISTKNDEVEVGDAISFRVVNDVYEGDELLFKKGTTAFGVVDFVHNNGWTGDSAEIKLVKFVIKNTNGEKIIINYPIDIKGNVETANVSRQVTSTFLTTVFDGILFVIRGSEIYIEPDTMVFNVFIER